MKEYKPILVFYLPIDLMGEAQFQTIKKEIIQVKEKTGYEIIFMSTESEGRVELLSVNKATIVEDIQKYIDLQSIKEKSNDKSN